ncbi:MAG: SGNH/GDSL hydrolase family protein [Chitinophagales bacterium]|nr:SGNH/GDSL hydrolase family protein [Chitinophagales bacterium]
MLSVFATLFVADIGIRYFTNNYDGYSESNGSGYYISAYRENKVKTFFVKVFGYNMDAEFGNPIEDTWVKKDEFEYFLHFNSLGFRGMELDTNSEKYKILALGDSYTEGIGAPDDSTWVVALSRLMEKKVGKDISYFNGGRSGGEPFRSFFILEKLIERGYRPDLIVLLINSSDLLDYVIYGGSDRFDQKFRGSFNNGPWWEPFYASSFIVRALVKKFGNMNHALISEEELKILEKEAEQEIYRIITQKYVPLADSLHIQLSVFTLPREFEVGEVLFPGLEKLKNQNIIYANFGRSIKSYLDNPANKNIPIYWKKDLHLNARGYDYIAKLMYDEIAVHQ